MNSSVIGKIEKAKRYAQERDRIRFSAFEVDFKGNNDNHKVGFADDSWHCSCDFFTGHKTCAHTMALERVLEGMLPASAATPQMQHAQRAIAANRPAAAHPAPSLSREASGESGWQARWLYVTGRTDVT